MKNLIPIFLICFLITSCNNSENTKDDKLVAEAPYDCMYSLNTEETKFQWTAFKTTAKIGVNGSFDKIQIKNSQTSNNIANVIIETKFSINLNTVNSGNPERDEKLKTYFFGSLENTDIFSGMVEECEGDNKSGNLLVKLNINNIDKQVQMKYSVSDETLKLNGTLDLLDWNANTAVESINNACLDLHKGADGISKTWSDMEISIEVPITKDCK